MMGLAKKMFQHRLANILIKLCQTHDKVVFVDDDRKNVNAAINLNIPNLKVIKAWD